MAILTAGTEMERARRAHEQASLAVVLAARLVEALGEPSRALDDLRVALEREEQAAQDLTRATLARLEAERAVRSAGRARPGGSPMLVSEARACLAAGPDKARIEAEAAVQALERGSEAAAARWALRAVLAEPGWRGLARVILGDEPEVVVHGS